MMGKVIMNEEKQNDIKWAKEVLKMNHICHIHGEDMDLNEITGHSYCRSCNLDSEMREMQRILKAKKILGLE